jgi:hypothetical protein
MVEHVVAGSSSSLSVREETQKRGGVSVTGVTGAEGWADMGKVIPNEVGATERAAGPVGVSGVGVIGKVMPREAGAAERAPGPVGANEVVWPLGAWLVWHDGHRMDECFRSCLLQ